MCMFVNGLIWGEMLFFSLFLVLRKVDCSFCSVLLFKSVVMNRLFGFNVWFICVSVFGRLLMDCRESMFIIRFREVVLKGRCFLFVVNLRVFFFGFGLFKFRWKRYFDFLFCRF